MFSSLKELESHETETRLSRIRRGLYYAAVFAASAVAFGGLYLGIVFLE